MTQGQNSGALRNITREMLEPLWLGSRLSSSEIGARLGVSGSGIRLLAKRLGLPKRGRQPLQKCSDAEFFRLWSAGVSVTDMARMLGYSGHGAVSTRARHMGLPGRQRVKGAGKNNGAGLCGWGGTITATQFREMQYADAMRDAR